MKLILHYLKRYPLLLLCNVISVFGFALVELGIPTIIAQMIDVGVQNQDQQYILQMGMLILVISLIGVSGTLLLGFCGAKISTNITRDIRNDIFQKVQSFSHTEFNHFTISSLITRTNNDAFQIQLFVNVILRTGLMTPVMIVVSYVMIISASLQLSYVVIATIPFIIGGVIYVAKKSEPISEKQQSSLDRMNRISKENLTGVRVIRSFTNDDYEQSRFNETNDVYTNQSKHLFKMMNMTGPIFFLLMNIAAVLIYWISANMIDAQTIQIGKIVAFMDYLFHAMFSVMLFCLVFVQYPRANVSAKRIQAVFDCDPLIHNEGKVMGNDRIESLCFDHVSFVYPDGEEAVLKDVSFQVKKGETIAFIGSTGSGKSTLINLIPRFYDCSEGCIRINGIAIKDYDIDALRSKIGFIPQKAVLFNSTIAENIRYGKQDASNEEVIHAAKVAQAYDFIMEKENGFDEMISEGATNVSGGQRQRLSIARALVRKPSLYIFDDSFSALDFKTDAKLRRELKKETKDAIVMIVAQRISSIMDANQIIVLNEGHVVGMGTHKELLQQCQIYREIALSQLSEEELFHA